MTVEHAELGCAHCGQEAEHELHYAGRLLESTRCTNCGHVVQLDQRVLLPAYLHDLEQRVVSKPGRLMRRAHQDRGSFLRALPGAIVRQPAKIAKELWTVLRR